MTELRRDPVIGQWVNVHVEDSLGPDHYEVEYTQDYSPE